MGIDVYLRWKDMTREEREAQYCGFDVTAGKVGYLREAYHGSPYATQILVPEAFAEHPEFTDEDWMNYDGEVIPNAVLRRRLPEVKKAVILRYKNVYGEEIDEEHPAVQSFIDFVELHAVLEKDGKKPKILASY